MKTYSHTHDRLPGPRWSLLLAGTLAGWLFAPASHATVMTYAELQLSAFSVTPSAGTVAWSGVWQATAFAEAANSLGGLAQNVQSAPASAAATAGVPMASATSSATVPASGGLFGQVTAGAGISTGAYQAASSASQVMLERSFSIVGATGPVTVSISSLIYATLTAWSAGGGGPRRTLSTSSELMVAPRSRFPTRSTSPGPARPAVR